MIKITTNHPAVKFKQNVLEIAANAKIDEPIEFTIDKSATIQINIGKNAQATIIEHFESKKKDTIEYVQTIQAAANSKLRIITIQNLGMNVELDESRSTQVSKSANVHFINFQLGAKKVYSKIIHRSKGKMATMNTDLLCRAKKDQDFEFTVQNNYQAENGRGKITVKGAAMDQAKLIIDGGIFISQKGKGTECFLKQDSLLLSTKAVIKATPALAIDTNDVKTSHSASITNVNEDVLFYMMNRGIEYNIAKKMLINGFLAEQVDKIKDLPKVQAYILSKF